MAKIIPPLNKHTLSRMTSGEKRVARCLKKLLEDDYLVWYDIPFGRRRRYPDFIILHPGRGLLFLEVKDWKPQTLKKITKADVTLVTNSGQATKPHPLEQARQYTYTVIDRLQEDARLVANSGHHKGKLIMPYGWGAVFTNISRQQVANAIPEDRREDLLPDHLMIYKDELTESADPETFQERLWGMFHYHFGGTLTLPQIDRIRGHLFPEIRIDANKQTDFFAEEDTESPSLPDIVKVLDVQQEQLARSLGEGHRVIHGVSGSGKTLILGYRCLHLARAMDKTILVLCFNITLAARLQAFIAAKGIDDGRVQVYHFHDWCRQQLTTYHVDVPISDRPYYELQPEAMIDAVDKEVIPKAQYGALLIDEGHDFKPEWLKLVVQMVDPEYDSLLLLYDDAQSIYKHNSGLGFTLSSVGIKAPGRTTILRLNYRNTREILQFAYDFANHYRISSGAKNDQTSSEDHIPLVKPEAAGSNGPPPSVHLCNTFSDEVNNTIKCLKSWHAQAVRWGDMAVLYQNKDQGEELSARLEARKIPHNWLNYAVQKKTYDPNEDRVTVVTVHSSKGLEFPRVIIVGIGSMRDKGQDALLHGSKLLYVGMTRAQECLQITTSKKNAYSRLLLG